MRVLYLTHAELDDESFGGALRSRHLRDALCACARVDTVVIHAGPRDEFDADWSETRVRRAIFHSSTTAVGAVKTRRRVAKMVREILSREHYDLVVARYLGLATYVPVHRWRQLVLDADDIFKTSPLGSASNRMSRLKFAVRNVIARAAILLVRHAWFVNPVDLQSVGKRGRASCLPNVVRLPDDARARPPVVPGRILMVGYFAHPPNAEGLLWFVENILPDLQKRVPDVHLRAIGKYPTGMGRDFPASVTMTGFVSDLSAEYDRCALVVAPIFSGGGTQIKVLEALAHARPLVTSQFAFAGFAEKLIDGTHLFVAQNSADWAAHCSHALETPVAAQQVAQRGAQIVLDTFGVHAMIEHVANTLDRLRRETP